MKDIKLPYKYQLSILLLFSGLFGFLVSTGFNLNWQVSVEAGQVLSGIVKYPANNIPQYMNLVKSWTILNQFSAILLRIGFSESVASFIITGLLGAVSFQAVALLFFSISRNVFLSLMVPFFIYFMSYIGKGVVYPIYFLSSVHSYGRLGLVFTLLVIGLFNSGCFKTASFFLGVAPCVHASIGTYCVLLVFLVLFFHYKGQRYNFREMAAFFLWGLFITLLSFMFQYSFIHGLPSLNYMEKKAYIDAFIKYWDYHRAAPFPYWSPGIFTGILGSIISFLVLRFRKINNTESIFVFRLFITAFFLSLVLSLITYLPADILPTLHILMPGRYINLNNLMFVTLLLALLTTPSSTLLDKLIFSFFVLGSISLKISFLRTLSIFNTTEDNQIKEVFYFMILMALLILISIVYQNFFLRFIKNKVKIIFILYRASLLALLALSVVILFLSFKYNNGSFKNTPPILKLAYAREGLLLPADDSFLEVQLQTRRPVLIDPNALDGFLFAPESGPYLNNVLEKVYGLNLFMPPSEGFRHTACIPAVYKKLWEERSAEEWLSIRNEFGVTDIFTRSDWHLGLPIVAESIGYILYTIPNGVDIENKAVIN
jgi:hypothetical protein